MPRYGRGTCEEITLSEASPSVDDLHLFINQEGRVCARNQNNVLTESDLYLYPNPVGKELTVGGLPCNTEFEVSVTHIQGMTVMPTMRMQTNVTGEFTMVLDELLTGVYLIRISNPTMSVMTKFVKQ